MAAEPRQYMRTSGKNDPVWVHTEPYSNRPQSSSLDKDIETDVCIIGSGIAGISIAEQLVRRGLKVAMVEARDILSGETGRTSGHLSSDLDDGYSAIAKTFGADGAKKAAESHTWALQRVGEISKQLGIECEYRQLKAYDISQYPGATKEHDDDIEEMREEGKAAKEAGLEAEYVDKLTIKGWDGKIDQRDGVVIGQQATFHPTKYCIGILHWLKDQPNFQCYTRTRVTSCQESGLTIPIVNVSLNSKHVKVETLNGHTITCDHAVQATCVPLQKLSVIVEMEFMRTYCIAIRVPKDTVEDCLIYDSADAYKYSRMTACDDEWDYMVVGGCDHKVGQENEADERYQELENWVRERFTHAGSVDYRWSGQILDPVDYMAYIGLNSGNQRTYVVTGDSGNGLTHGVIAGQLIADQIQGIENPWTSLYDPKRKATIASKLPSMIQHDVQINSQYRKVLQSDIKDVEDLGLGEGGILNPTLSKPQAVYKDENGKIHRMSAFCPHLKGVVCWNNDEKSWDCPIHGSRFSAEGIQLMGPAKTGLAPFDEDAKQRQQIAIES